MLSAVKDELIVKFTDELKWINFQKLPNPIFLMITFNFPRSWTHLSQNFRVYSLSTEKLFFCYLCWLFWTHFFNLFVFFHLKLSKNFLLRSLIFKVFFCFRMEKLTKSRMNVSIFPSQMISTEDNYSCQRRLWSDFLFLCFEQTKVQVSNLKNDKFSAKSFSTKFSFLLSISFLFCEESRTKNFLPFHALSTG